MIDNIIRDARDQRYASHLPVLSAWLSGSLWLIVEFGCGRFSTPELARHAAMLICFEKSQSWINQIRPLVPSADLRLVPQSLAAFETVWRAHITDDHVAFVDGSPSQWRVHAIRWAAECRPVLIFAHDWNVNQCGYGYHELKNQLQGYELTAYKCQLSSVRTAVFRRLDYPLTVPKPEHHKQCTSVV